jgi:putative heme transporter
VADTAQRTGRRLVGPLLATIVIVGTFTYVLPRFANYGDVAETIGNTSTRWGMALLAAGILNIATYAPNWMASLPGLSYWRSLRVTLAGTAIANLAPFGGAVSMGVQYSMFRSWGFERSESSRAMVVTGIWNNLVNLGLPLTGLLLLTVRGGRNAALQVSAQIGAVIFVIVLFAFWQVLRSDAGAARVGRFADSVRNRWLRLRRKPLKAGLDIAVTQFRNDSIALLRRRWLAITVTTIIGVLTVFVVLAVAIRAVGIVGAEVTLTEAFAAWASTRLLSTAIPVTPGGLGVVDVALTSALSGFGGNTEQVVAAVLLYRAITWLPPVVLGAFASLGWRKKAAAGG